MLSERDRRILDAPNFASLATVMPDGAPHVSTVWLDVDGEEVLVNTGEGLVKTENVRRDARVAISVFDQQDDPYEQVVVRGTVVDITPDGADEHIDRLANKYLGVDSYPWREPGEQRLILRIRIDRVSAG
ncbi:MAG TPA: PPOX class F420-dependent oxidoreductase [Actinomycetota bacterium]|nr:PPOX class F420-dependent oxidoreductase [Actinomycetota bacterium]